MLIGILIFYIDLSALPCCQCFRFLVMIGKVRKRLPNGDCIKERHGTSYSVIERLSNQNEKVVLLDFLFVYVCLSSQTIFLSSKFHIIMIWHSPFGRSYKIKHLSPSFYSIRWKQNVRWMNNLLYLWHFITMWRIRTLGLPKI